MRMILICTKVLETNGVLMKKYYLRKCFGTFIAVFFLQKKRNKRRSSRRLSKKPKIEHVEVSSDENEDIKAQTRIIPNKRPKPVVPEVKKRNIIPFQDDNSFRVL